MIVYITPHKINNLQIPTRVQVLYASNYCSANSLSFCLPVSESLLEPPHRLFSDLISQSNHSVQFIVFSKLYLATPVVRDLLLGHLNSDFGADSTFYFTYEDTVCSVFELLGYIDMVLRYRACAKMLPTN